MIIVGQVFVLSSRALIFGFGIGLVLTSTPINIAKNENTGNDKQQSFMASMQCAIKNDDMTSLILLN